MLSVAIKLLVNCTVVYLHIADPSKKGGGGVSTVGAPGKAILHGTNVFIIPMTKLKHSGPTIWKILVNRGKGGRNPMQVVMGSWKASTCKACVHG